MGIPRGSQQTVTVEVTWGQIIPHTEARDSILISNPSATPVYLSFGVNGAGTNGVYLSESTLPLIVTRRDFANLVEGPIYAAAPGGATALVYLEVLS